jgi:hypothetical protein
MTQEETIFLNSDAAKVTNARVVIGNQTFAMSGITSVEVRTEEPKTSFLMSFLVMLIGLAMTPKILVIGILVAIAGIGAMVVDNAKAPKFHLFLRAAGGEVNALTSTNATDIEIIASAITDAMVHRG